MKKKAVILTVILSLVVGSLSLTAHAAAPTAAAGTIISAGEYHSMAIKEDGSLWGWGLNSLGQIGDGTTENRLRPVKIIDDVVSVTAGTDSTMAIKSDGSLWAWGDGFESTPAKILDGVALVGNVTSEFDVVMSDGSMITHPDGVAYHEADGVVDISPSSYLKSDGSVWAKEYSGYRKVLDGAVAVDGPCAIMDDGSVWVWEYNSYIINNTPAGSTPNITDPVQVTEIADAVAISSVRSNSFAIKSDGTLWGWGNNAHGALGIGGSSVTRTPVKVEENVVAASTNIWHSLFLKSDGSLWGCGFNLAGALGNGEKQSSEFIPIKIMDGVKLPNGDAASDVPSNLTSSSDTPSGWAAVNVSAAIAENLVPSSLQSKYTQATTRAEFCALAVALYENVMGSEITGRAEFGDTDDVNVAKAAFIEVVNGIEENVFDPNAELTREQAATMLSRLAGAVGKPLAASDPTFADSGSVSDWAFDAVGQVQAAKIMDGVGNNTFAPKDPYTREQSIITIMRLYEAVG